MGKIKTIIKDGLDPFFEGKKNYDNPNKEVELLAIKRADICVKCPFFKTEPNDFFKVKDERILKISDKMCDECGCELPYKTRQNKSICKKWENI